MGGARTLVASEHQQFGMDSKHLGSDLLEAPSRLDAGAKEVDPVGRDGFDSLLAAGHEGESP